MFESILGKYSPEKENLIYILHDIQDQNSQNYVSEEAVKQVGKYLDIPISHIYGVITFYTMFSTKPRGKNIIRLCESPPCYLKGSENILKYLKDKLNVKVNETTEDGFFTLELCACLGVCGNAPVMMINEEIYGDLSEEKINNIIEKYRGGVK